MTAQAAIQAVYSDYRRVKGRKVLQIVLEVPIEQAKLVHDAFGEPSPDGSTWVAVALMDLTKADQQKNKGGDVLDDCLNGLIDAKGDAIERPKQERRPFNTLPLSQQAGILCEAPMFQAFVWNEKGPGDDAAGWLRTQCGIASRSQLNTDEIAATKFKQIKDRYDAWQRM